MKPLLAFLLPLALAACATTADPDAPPVDVGGAQVVTRTESNGDVVDEYRVGGALRMVKVKPLRGPTYYLYDQNGDGHLDSSTGKDTSPVYWKLYSW